MHKFAGSQNDKRCLCSYSSKKDSSNNYLSNRFYEHINWGAILEEISSAEDYKERVKLVNKKLTLQVNQDLAPLNLKITNEVDWPHYFDSTRKDQLQFEKLSDIKIVPSF